MAEVTLRAESALLNLTIPNNPAAIGDVIEALIAFLDDQDGDVDMEEDNVDRCAAADDYVCEGVVGADFGLGDIDDGEAGFEDEELSARILERQRSSDIGIRFLS